MEFRHTDPLMAERPGGRIGRRGKGRTTRGTKDVELVFDSPRAQSVSVAGTFNNWNPEQTPLEKGPDGKWKTRLSLKPGRYEYRFVADGQWLSDPAAVESIPNEFGSTNSVLTV